MTDRKHSHTHTTGQSPWHDLPAGLTDHLDLEARLSAPIVENALTAAGTALTTSPATVVDLGSGTGAGTIALATHFPEAQVHSLDVAPDLLERLSTAAAQAGVAHRVHGHRLDLDGDWPTALPGPADLVWAALSLHHVADPARTVRQAFSALRPGGALVLTEVTDTATFDPPDLGTGRTSLTDRLRDALAEQHPGATDWSLVLTETGFVHIQRHEWPLTASGHSADGARYLAAQLRSCRDRLVADLSSADRASLDAAIEALDAGSSDLSLTAGRAVWVAVRPEIAEPPADQAEVVVVGAGSAGLAAAVALARSRREVVVIDAGQPRNAPAEGAHNVLGQEGTPPLELLARGRAEAEAYGVTFVSGRATGASGTADDFRIEVDGGAHRVQARRVILATGLVDGLPAVPGINEGWGRSVLHCPFCHGWEVRDQRIAILTSKEVAVHQAVLFRQLSDQVTLFLHEAPDPTEEQWEQLAALNVSVVRPRVERLVMEGTQVRAVEIEDGRTFDADAVVVAPELRARTELYEALGGEPTSTPFGSHIPADQRGMTAIPGVWAAGNASELMASLLPAMAAGMTTGGAVHGDLAFADLGQALEARRMAG